MNAGVLAAPERAERPTNLARAIGCWIRRSLFRKLFLAFLVLVSGGLLTNSLVDLTFSYQGNQAVLKRLQTREAVVAAAGIKQFVDEIEARIAGVVRPLRAVGADDREQRQEAYFTVLRLAPAISQLSYLDASGNRLLKLSRVAINEAAGPADANELEAWDKARPDQPYRSGVDFLDDSEPYVWIGLRDRGAGGVTVAMVNLTFIRDVISRVQVGRAGVAYMVDREGRLIAYPDISPVLQHSSLGHLPQVAVALASPTGPPAGEPIVGRSLDGHEVVSYYQAVEPLGGWVFVEWPLAEAREPIREAVLRTALLLALGLTLSVLASYLVTRKLVVDPIRALEESAARLDEDTLDRRIDLRTGDELEALADEFNRMAARLDESYKGLEQQVAQRTSELNEQKNELAEALERQTAVSEVLRLITRSPTDREAVLEAVAENAAVLCEASGASIWLRHGDLLRRTAGYGSLAPEVGAERVISRDWITGRAAVEARTVHEPDLASLDETEYAQSERRFQHGHLSALSTPIMREGEVAGVISIGRRQAESFSDRQIELLETFADQIVIALELTRLFEEIRNKSIALEVASRQRQRFLRTMNHQMRNPLNTILLFTRSIRDGTYDNDPATMRDRVRRAEANVERLLLLVDDALKLSPVYADKLTLALAEYTLGDVLETVRRMLEPRAREKGLHFDVALPPNLPTGRGDEGKLTEALINLVDNAIKFTEAGEVCVQAHASDDHFAISVRDTGPGIPEVDREKIFEEFYQASSSSMRKESGTGLGLAIARYYVEAHGGRIRVESCQGRGSTFRVELPIRVEGKAEAS